MGCSEALVERNALAVERAPARAHGKVARGGVGMCSRQRSGEENAQEGEEHIVFFFFQAKPPPLLKNRLHFKEKNIMLSFLFFFFVLGNIHASAPSKGFVHSRFTEYF